MRKPCSLQPRRRCTRKLKTKISESNVPLTERLGVSLNRGRSIGESLAVGPNRCKIETRRWIPPAWAKHLPRRYHGYLSRAGLGTYGPWEFVDEVENLITNVGRDNIHNSALQASGQPVGLQYMAISSDTGGTAVTDTTLAGEITGSGLARALATYAHSAGTNSSTLTYTYTNNTAGAVSAIQKAATFNASSSGTMGFENTFTSVTLQIGDQLKLTWTQNVG